MLHFLFGLLIVAILLSFRAGQVLVGLCVVGAIVFVALVYHNENQAKVAHVVAPATAQKLLVDALPAAPLDFDKCVAGPRGHHCRAYIDPLRECHPDWGVEHNWSDAEIEACLNQP